MDPTPITESCTWNAEDDEKAESPTKATTNITNEIKLLCQENTSKTHLKVKPQNNLIHLFKNAVETNSDNVICLLLEQGLNLNAALDIAINSGKEIVVDLVIDRGADLDEGLYFAVKANNKNILGLLLRRGANINTNKRNGNTPLHASIIQKCDVNVVDFLLNNGSDVNARTKSNKTALGLVQNFIKGKNDLATKERLEHISELLRTHNLQDNVFECLQGLPDGLSGYSYQIKLLTLYAIINTKLAMSKGMLYELGTEVKDLLPFDDIYLKKSQDGKNNCEFVQVKQTKKPEFNKIRESNFFFLIKLSNNNVKEFIKGNDSVVKMFIKFKDITENLGPDVIGDFIYCTNTSFQVSTTTGFVSVENINNDLLCNIGKKMWKVQNWRYLYAEIKIILCKLITSSQYFQIIDEEIRTNINEQMNLIINYINEGYITNDSYEDMSSFSIHHIAEEGLKALRYYYEYLNTIKVKVKSASDENSLNNYCLPLECDIHNFTEDLEHMKRIALIRIKELCQMLKSEEEIFLNFNKPDDDFIVKKIQTFVNHFYVYTDCPTGDMLDEIIAEEIHQEFRSHNSKLFADHCVQYFYKWVGNFKNERGHLFMAADGKRLFRDLRIQTIKGFSKSYFEDLINYNIHFGKSRYKESVFWNFLNDRNCKIIHVITKHTRLNSIKILHILKEFERQDTKFNLENVLWTSSDIILKSRDTENNLSMILSSNSNSEFIVIEFINDIVEYRNLHQVFNNVKIKLTKSENKKIILIAPSDNSLATSLKCLVKDHTSFESIISINDLTDESRENILNSKVKLLNDSDAVGTDLKVKDFLDVATDFQVIDEDIMSMMITEKQSFKISDRIAHSEDYEDYYIPRRVHRQFMDTETLLNIYCCIFITGITSADLISKLPYPYYRFVRTTEETEILAFAYIVMPDKNLNKTVETEEEAFNRMSSQCNKWFNYIWVEFKDEMFILKDIKPWRSDQSIEFKEPDVDTVTLDKHSFPPEDLKQKVVILENNPGEGKSTMLTQLAHALKKKSPRTWIIRIDLRNYADNALPISLNDITFSHNDCANAVELITLMMVEGNKEDVTVKLERRLLRAALHGYGEIGVVLLFDGFDEISPLFKENACILIKALAKTKVEQLWVTTRMHLKTYLEAHLQVPAFRLTAFSNEEQIRFLNGFWKWNFKNYRMIEGSLTDETVIVGIKDQLKLCLENCYNHISSDDFESIIKCENITLADLKKNIDSKIDMSKFSKALLETWKDAINDGGDFSTVPLNLEMLARNVFEGQWKITKTRKIDIFKMYTEFVENKLTIFEQSKSTCREQVANQVVIDQAKVAAVSFREMHREIAVKTLFQPKFSLPDMNVCNKYKNLNERLTRIGLVKQYGNHLEFVHRSFAEYFFSEYLTIHLYNPNVQSEFLKKILQDNDYFLVRNFFDGFLSRSHLLNFEEDCRGEDFDTITDTSNSVLHLSIEKEIVKQYRNGETNMLHYAASAGHLHLFKFIISELHKVSISALNDLFKIIKDSVNVLTRVDKSSFYKKYYEGAFQKNDFIVACTSILENVCEQANLLKYLAEIKLTKKSSECASLDEIRNIIDIVKGKNEKFDHLLIKCHTKKCAELHSVTWNLHNQIGELIIKTAEDYIGTVNKDRNMKSRTHEAALSCVEYNFTNVIDVLGKLDNIVPELVMKCDKKIYSSLHKAVYMAHTNIFNAIANTVKAYREIKKTFLTNRCKNHQTPLHYASLNGHSELCRLIIKTVEEFPSAMNDFIMEGNIIQRTALHLSAKRGHSEVCNIIIENVKKYPNTLENLLTARDIHEHNALSLAVRNDHINACEIILKTAKMYPNIIEAIVTSRDEIEQTVLHLAVRKGLSNITNLLLEAVNENPDILKKLITECDRNGYTLMHYVAKYGHKEVCGFIIKSIEQFYPDILEDVLTKPEVNGRTIMDLAARNGYSDFWEAVLDILKKHLDMLKRVITKVTLNNQNVLHIAAIYGHPKVCDVILKTIREYPDIMKYVLTQCDSNKCTPLTVAAMRGFSEVCETIMNHAMENPHALKEILTKCDSEVHTPLDVAAWYGHSVTCDVIIKIAKAYPDVIHHLITKYDNINCTVLHLSVSNKDTAACKAIIKYANKSPNILKDLMMKCGRAKRTALHVAAWHGKTDICEVLIKTSCKYPDIITDFITKCDENNQTALHLASRRGHEKTTNAILATPKEHWEITRSLLTKCDDESRTALHVAAKRGRSEVCKIILETAKEFLDILKYLICKRDKYNRTALDLARCNGHSDTYSTIFNIIKESPHIMLTVSNPNDDDNMIDFNLALRDDRLCNLILKSSNICKDIMEDLIGKCDWNTTTPLHVAAQKGLIDVCEIIIYSTKKYPDVIKRLLTKRDYNNRTPLHIAALYSHSNVCEVIISNANEVIDITTELIRNGDRNGHTPLHLAAQNGLGGICIMIIEIVKANEFNFRELLLKSDINKRTPLHLAAGCGNNDVCEIIIKAINLRFDVMKNLMSSTDDNNQTILHLAARKGYKIVCDLILRTAKEYSGAMEDILTSYDDSDQTVLHLAARNGLVGVCDKLLTYAKFCSSNLILKNLLVKCDANKFTCLDIAAMHGNAEICDNIFEAAKRYPEILKELMVKCGKRSPLDIAAIYGHSEVCSVVIKHSQKYEDIMKHLITKYDQNERTVLHLAAKNGLTGVCEKILKLGKNYSETILKELVLKVDVNERSALHLAAWNGHGNTVDMILNIANKYPDILFELITKCDKNKRTVLHRAIANNHKEASNAILNIVIKNSPMTDVLTKCDKNNRTAFHLAAQSDLSDICDIIMKIAKKFNALNCLLIRDINDETALDIAAWNGGSTICEMIIKTFECDPSVLTDLLINSKCIQTPLHLAASNCHGQVCELILTNCEKYPDILKDVLLKCDYHQCTALHVAALNGDTDIFEIIMRNAKKCKIAEELILRYGYCKQTALQMAARKGHSKFCEMMLKTATEYGDVVKELLTKYDWKRHTCLQLAARGGFAETCEVILKYAEIYSDVYVDIITRLDRYKRNPMTIAKQKGYDEVFNLICENANKNSDKFNT